MAYEYDYELRLRNAVGHLFTVPAGHLPDLATQGDAWNTARCSHELDESSMIYKQESHAIAKVTARCAL